MENPKQSSAAASSSSTTASPLKPRLIWRGALHLQDGTALPGIAFVSNVQPCFSSHLQAARENDAPTTKPPLSLSKEQQDALSLSIEMVRHAPIKIVEVVEKVDIGDDGTLVKPKRIVSTNPRENSDSVKVSFQAGGGIRMYVDPAYPSTVAYMERIFCYDGDSDEEDITNAADQQHKGKLTGSANNVIVLSLDKSYRYSLEDPSTKDQDDVFSEDAMSAWNDLKSSTAGTIEAVLLGIKVKGEDGSTNLELHVGQKVVSKVLQRNSSSSSLLGSASHRNTNAFGSRPDDPAPRALSRVLSAKYRSSPALVTQRTTSSSSSFTAPLPPSHRASFTSLKRPPISSTSDGDARSSSMPVLKSETSFTKPDTKRVKINQQEDGEDIDPKIQERNRSLIKKLVHHQLLGKGVEKSDEDYLACFGPTCNGTVLAFKKQIKIEAIEKTQAAIIVEKHLDMYL
jgi:hypothetical protein